MKHTYLPSSRPQLWLAGVLLAGCSEADSVALEAPELARLGDWVDGSPREPLDVVGGGPVPTCAWPSAAAMTLCTGTLVHPEIIMTAAHCDMMQPGSMATFGDTSNGTVRARIEICKNHPGWRGTASSLAQNVDFRYCKLQSPVTTVPIVPILMGCETEQLKSGAKVTFVGFGADSPGASQYQGGFGVKRVAQTSVAMVMSNGEVILQAGGKGACFGDSGGPALLQLASGEWRVFGVASYIEGPVACGSSRTHYGAMHKIIPWVEEDSGVDVTPCHDADGTWNPGPDCHGFPLEPDKTHGSWADACNGGPVDGPSRTCAADDVPPTVEIVAPSSGATVQPDTSFEIVVEAEDDRGPVKQVTLLVDGDALESKEAPPFVWEASFPSGSYSLTARAVDHDDNEAVSDPVIVHARTSGGDSDPSGDAEDGDAGDDIGDGTDGPADGSGSAGGSDSDEGGQADDTTARCSMQRHRHRSTTLGAIMLLAWTRRRRR